MASGPFDFLASWNFSAMVVKASSHEICFHLPSPRSPARLRGHFKRSGASRSSSKCLSLDVNCPLLSGSSGSPRISTILLPLTMALNRHWEWASTSLTARTTFDDASGAAQAGFTVLGHLSLLKTEYPNRPHIAPTRREDFKKSLLETPTIPFHEFLSIL
jgi:hypothetical protein